MCTYFLDADIFRLYQTGHATVVERVTAHIQEVCLSSVTIEEMIMGRLSLINRARSGKGGIAVAETHAAFTGLLEDIQAFPLLPYTEEAERIFQGFSASIKRIGPQDCRLAAQAMVDGRIVVTCNVRDFVSIGAVCEDWSLRE